MTADLTVSTTQTAPRKGTGRRGIGISLRVTLLSWVVALTTLAIFVVVTIPQQKKILVQNLQSKANSVAVSLHGAAAGAAINEDFATVVSTAQTMLEGDKAIEFMVVMKNDGYAIAIEQNGWRVEPTVAPYWHNRERKPAGGIYTVPMFNRRVFHFAQPFDYSGIQWGWIHVGLSLTAYDHSILILYRSIAVVGLGCIALSLLLSNIYARRMVRPIIKLHDVVQIIASGNFSVRAIEGRSDEMGALAESINTMAEALLRRDHILESIKFSAQQFLRSPRWEDSIEAVLARIGEAADVSRALIYKNYTSETGRPFTSLQFEWTAKGITPRRTDPEFHKIFYDTGEFQLLYDRLSRNEVFEGLVPTPGQGVNNFSKSYDVRAFITIPVFNEDILWGFIALEECRRDRVWTDAERDSVGAEADMLGATITRQGFQDDLLEAKATLEHRVMERTEELESQVQAKQKALSALSEAQSSLLEVSRAAGMAEVANGVLHNVGNVLNSVNVSCNLITDQLNRSRMANVAKVAELMEKSQSDLVHFFSEDPRGLKIPAYLTSLAAALKDEHNLLLNESEALHDRIEHIKEIVSMQQNYGRVSGVSESIHPEKLIEDALTLNAGALVRHSVTVVRQYENLEPITIDKHAVLQILLNLINNAKYACSENGQNQKTITMSLFNCDPEHICFQVKDNGVGIAKENLNRIFQHGFTTRKSGHGFGLHSGALTARQLGGSLNVHSDGIALGATFTLKLPRHSGG